MESVNSIERWSDGGCTWLPDRFWIWDWQYCCINHDWTDDNIALIQCLTDVFGWWAFPFIILIVGIMLLVQPIYSWLYKNGHIKKR